MGRFVSPFRKFAVIFGEKGATSMDDQDSNPTRLSLAGDSEIFLRNLDVVWNSSRSHLLRSRHNLALPGAIGGHRSGRCPNAQFYRGS